MHIMSGYETVGCNVFATIPSPLSTQSYKSFASTEPGGDSQPRLIAACYEGPQTEDQGVQGDFVIVTSGQFRTGGVDRGSLRHSVGECAFQHQHTKIRH